MRYCPQCSSEYENTIQKCSDCNVDLVPYNKVEKDRDTENYVEVYVTNQKMEMDLLRDLLEKNNIHCTVRDLHMSSLPMNIGEMAEIRIEVAQHDEGKAKELIQEMISSGFISDTGEFIDED